MYNWLGRNRSDNSHLNFNRSLLYLLIGIGVLLFVIEMVALGNGLALARTITDIGGRAVHRH